METTNPTTLDNPAYASDTSDEQARGGRRAKSSVALASRPNHPDTREGSLSQPAGSLLKGATDADGKPKDAALLLGIKLDLDAEIHLTARVRGDITVGLY
ncbi:uncharacterized protein K452DRAFT_300294 [Aplosporella prunicola CBS 121167]|uniref:Uncharacterized protein n=1 Tax=Aplosporella prunicola CBS 121167 TaxID=1176127 RepID=A0A6A6B9Q0_9PEZI|nr:uncharacterized protein K452DRAFT_300294 [Aplosporella prunicola CBS 121167]KAF2139211.1 hypothetical protein K452DRAFT_300294 [Aplosporella prunicola CBS 121167]